MIKNFFTLSTIFLFVFSFTAKTQSNTPDSLYIDYSKYFNELANGFKANGSFLPKTIKEIKSEATLLKDDERLITNTTLTQAGKKELSPEDIFAKRKNSVFIVGKFSKDTIDPAKTNFNLTGTAFAISENGICVTNYHVLQDLINKEISLNKSDSVYFIATSDGKGYFIDSIMAYSVNNDLVIFRVNMHGSKLHPVSIGKPSKVGSAVYCISHPLGYFYYFTKGIVARNVTIFPQQIGFEYNQQGAQPIRMDITADYAVGSSGGPLFDDYGNLIGISSQIMPISEGFGYPQMVVKTAIPVKALLNLLKN